MAYKRKNKKNQEETLEEFKERLRLEHDGKHRKCTCAEYPIPEEVENEWDSLPLNDFEVDEFDYANNDPEGIYQPISDALYDDIYLTDLVEEMFPDGSGMEEFRVIFKMGYMRAISDVNNGDV